MKQYIDIEQYFEVKELRRKFEDLGLLRPEEVTLGKMFEILQIDNHIEICTNLKELTITSKSGFTSDLYGFNPSYSKTYDFSKKELIDVFLKL